MRTRRGGPLYGSERESCTRCRPLQRCRLAVHGARGAPDRHWQPVEGCAVASVGISRAEPSTGSDAGFTLAEVLLAAGLLASAVAALATLVTLAIQANHSSGDLTRAVVFAQQTLEELRAPAGPPPAANGAERLEYLDGDGRLVAAPDRAIYTRRWRVSPLPGAPPGTALVRVEVARAVAARGRLPAAVVGVLRPAP